MGGVVVCVCARARVCWKGGEEGGGEGGGGGGGGRGLKEPA